MKKPFSRDLILREIPQLNLISQEDMREKAIKAWELDYTDSDYEDLETVNFSPYYPKPTLLGHTRSVTEASLLLAKNLLKEYDYPIDLDDLIVMAALHDISKLRENISDGNGGVKKGPVGAAFQHAFFSAHYAIEAGLSDKVVAGIFAHTGNTKQLPTSLEAILVTYGDMADADAHRFSYDRPLQVAKLHK